MCRCALENIMDFSCTHTHTSPWTTYFHLWADELVQPVEIGKMMIVIGVPVFDSSRKVIVLEVCHVTNDGISPVRPSPCSLTSTLQLIELLLHNNMNLYSSVSDGIKCKVKFPVLVTECWARSWSPVYRQSARRWLSHPPSGRLRLPPSP